MKIVSQLDTEGYFVSPTIADESPLEPGVFMLPALSVDVEPPIAQPGHRSRYDGTTFVDEPIKHVDSVYPAPPTTSTIDPSLPMGTVRIGLLRMNILNQVDALITDPEARIKWEYDAVVQRNGELVRHFGLTQPQLDVLFSTSIAS